ncbi:MAG: hypothetical protein AAF557_14365 [Pseudomonadota bacterium]
MTDQDKNQDLDDLIRAASARETDEGTTFRSVLGWIDAEEKRTFFRLPSFGPNMAAAGFAAMLFAAGITGYALPELTLGDPEDDFLLLAMGDPGATSGGFLPALLERSE